MTHCYDHECSRMLGIWCVELGWFFTFWVDWMVLTEEAPGWLILSAFDWRMKLTSYKKELFWNCFVLWDINIVREANSLGGTHFRYTISPKCTEELQPIKVSPHILEAVIHKSWQTSFASSTQLDSVPSKREGYSIKMSTKIRCKQEVEFLPSSCFWVSHEAQHDETEHFLLYSSLHTRGLLTC